MTALDLLFSYEGRTGRRAFAIALVATLAILAFSIYGSFLILSPAATFFRPIGINAGAVQTAFFVFVGVLGLWVILALVTKRLRDAGRPIILAPIAIIPPLSVLILNGLLTIRPLVEIPALTQQVIYFVCGGIGVVMLTDALALPSIKQEASPTGYLEGPDGGRSGPNGQSGPNGR